MATSILVSDASFTKYVRRALPPYLANCLGFWLFGTSDAESIKNRLISPAAPAMTKVGTVTHGANYSSVTNPNANGFRSGITRTGPFTMILVHSANQDAHMGHWNVGSYDESGLLHAGTLVRGYVDGWTTIRTAVTVASVAGYAMSAFTYSDPVPSTYRGNAGALLSNVGPNYSQSQTATELRVGACGIAGTTEVYAGALYYDRALTAAELLDVYLWLASDVMAPRGITLL